MCVCIQNDVHICLIYTIVKLKSLKSGGKRERERKRRRREKSIKGNISFSNDIL